jgi:hypothetical protein
MDPTAVVVVLGEIERDDGSDHADAEERET